MNLIDVDLREDTGELHCQVGMRSLDGTSPLHEAFHTARGAEAPEGGEADRMEEAEVGHHKLDACHNWDDTNSW